MFGAGGGWEGWFWGVGLVRGAHWHPSTERGQGAAQGQQARTRPRTAPLSQARTVPPLPARARRPLTLCPDTDTDPMGLRNVTMGASLRKGIIMPNSAPSQWM